MSAMATIPIQSLSPETAPDPGTSIRGIVTLSWPYSSSTRQCALLIADPDFRLRAKRGQVRVRFTAASAEAVAKAHVGIGDEVVLHLEGAKWAQDIEVTRTPGRSLDGELLFRNRLGLILAQADGDVNIDINATSPSPKNERPQNTIISTPLPRYVQTLRSSFDGSLDSPPIYSSPAFTQRPRLSSHLFLGSAYDPFMDVDLGDEQPAKRQRTSFGTVGQWRYAERSPSPGKETFDGDVADEVYTGNDEVLGLANDANEIPTEIDEESSTSMQPSLATNLALPRVSPEEAMDIDKHDVPPQTSSLDPTDAPGLPPNTAVATQLLELDTSGPASLTSALEISPTDVHLTPSTPLLQAVPNSALPYPSPFATKAARTDIVPYDDVSSRMGDIAKTISPPTQPSAADKDIALTATAKGVEGALADAPQSANERNRSGVAQHETAEEDNMPLASHAQDIIDHNDTYSNSTPSMGSRAQDTSRFTASNDPSTVARDESLAAPSTPTKIPVQAFGFDGTSSAKSEARVTPQSERERVMSRTFRSLFGFTKLPVVQAEATERAESPTPRMTELEDTVSRDPDDQLQLVGSVRTGEHRQPKSPVMTVPARSPPDSGLFVADEKTVGAPATSVPLSEIQDDRLLAVKPESAQDLPQSHTANTDVITYETYKVAGTASSVPEVVDLLSSSDVEEEVEVGVNEESEREGVEDEEVVVEEEEEEENMDEDKGAEADLGGSEDDEIDGAEYFPTYEKRRDPELEYTEAMREFSTAGDSNKSGQDRELTNEPDELFTQQDDGTNMGHQYITAQSPFVPDSYAPDELNSMSEVVNSTERLAEISSVGQTPVLEGAPHSAVHHQGLLREGDQSMEHSQLLHPLHDEFQVGNNVAEQPIDLGLLLPPLTDQPATTNEQNLAVDIGTTFEESLQPPPISDSRPTEVIELGSSSPMPVVDHHRAPADADASDKALATVDLQMETSYQERPVRERYNAPCELLVESQVSGFESQAEVRSEIIDLGDIDQSAPQEVKQHEAIDSLQIRQAVSNHRDRIVEYPALPQVDVIRNAGGLHKSAEVFEEEAATTSSQNQVASSPSPPRVKDTLIESEARFSSIEPGQDLQLSPPDQRAAPYSSLPPTPLESQSQADHDFSSGVDQMRRTLQDNNLPETPQLTQTESDLQMLAQGIVTQDPAIAEHTANDDLMDVDASHGSAMPAVKNRSNVDRVQSDNVDFQDPGSDQLVESALPDARPASPSGGVLADDIRVNQSQTNGARIELEPPTTDIHVSAPLRARKTPARKSLKSHLSNVPDVISAWFSPKRSSTEILETTSTIAPSVKRAGKRAPESDMHALTKDHEATIGPIETSQENGGVLTTMAYFTSLANLHRKLNMPSQEFYGASTVDVLAVVTDSTKVPERAKSGPRDYYTIFRVVDTSASQEAAVRVEVFRPWKAVLPVAGVGDVILLRSFTVKSRKRQPYLLSTDASAWCVWRYAEDHNDKIDDARPVWAQIQEKPHVSEVREEIKGPPVELGAEERRRAKALHEWWVATGEEHVGDELHDANDHAAMQEYTAPVAAKL